MFYTLFLRKFKTHQRQRDYKRDNSLDDRRENRVTVHTPMCGAKTGATRDKNVTVLKNYSAAYRARLRRRARKCFGNDQIVFLITNATSRAYTKSHWCVLRLTTYFVHVVYRQLLSMRKNKMSWIRRSQCTRRAAPSIFGSTNLHVYCNVVYFSTQNIQNMYMCYNVSYRKSQFL